jgi:hypothetical protein
MMLVSSTSRRPIELCSIAAESIKVFKENEAIRMSFKFAYMKIEGISTAYDHVVQMDNSIWKDAIFWTLLQLYRSGLISNSPFDILFNDAPFILHDMAEPISNVVSEMKKRYTRMKKQI